MLSLDQKLKSEIENLSSVLFSTLDEGIFFNELSKFLTKKIGADKSFTFILGDKNETLLTCRNGRIAAKRIALDSEPPVRHVINTKRPYFSNNLSRDPLFSELKRDGIEAELILPILFDGVLIATIHIQSKANEITTNDLTLALSILGELESPISNMKMYLTAKFLNETLLRKIEEKETELAKSTQDVNIHDSLKISEEPILYSSKKMEDVVNLADKVASSDIQVLISGDKGTGKELLAKRIHCKSKRKNNAYVSIDCSGKAEDRLEIELFGIEGKDEKIGAFELSNNGTIVLKNIDKVGIVLQGKIVQFLKERRGYRVFGKTPFKSNSRVISLTKVNLFDLIGKGEFREDFYYLVSTFSLMVPVLSDREDDLEILANKFLNNNRSSENQKSFSPCAIRAIKDYSWAGNVSELKNVINKAYFSADGFVVEKSHLPESVFQLCEEVDNEEQEETSTIYTGMTLGDLEKAHICSTLNFLSGNKTKTAKTLGITVKTLYNKLHTYGMIQPKEA